MTLRTVGAGTSITTGTSSQQSGFISGKSTALRVVATGQNTHVAIGTDPTAAVTDFVVPKDSAATLAFSNTSAKVVSISTSTTYTLIDFPQGTSSPFGVGDYVTLDLADGSDQDYYPFTHKRVYAVYDKGRTAYARQGENWFGQRIVIENDYGRNISTSLLDNNTTLRASFKVAARTDTGSGKLYIQQVQISGEA
jgi:hypothetical protein|tara:strand:+ start:490 stop:1074 length:585 start_codon:yes stop_codon:yes gene_type:complete